MISEHGCDSVHLCNLIDELFQISNADLSFKNFGSASLPRNIKTPPPII